MRVPQLGDIWYAPHMQAHFLIVNIVHRRNDEHRYFIMWLDSDAALEEVYHAWFEVYRWVA